MDSRLPHIHCFSVVKSFLFAKDFQRCGSRNLGGLSPWALPTGQDILRNCRTCALCCTRMRSRSSALQKTSACGGTFSPTAWCASQNRGICEQVSPMWAPQSRRKSHMMLVSLSKTVYRQSRLICHPFPSFNKDFWKTLGSHSGLHSIHFGDSKEKHGNVTSKHSLMKFLQ